MPPVTAGLGRRGHCGHRGRIWTPAKKTGNSVLESRDCRQVSLTVAAPGGRLLARQVVCGSAFAAMGAGELLSQGAGRITGVAVAAGERVIGAQVSLAGASAPAARTGEDGRFEVATPGTGDVRLVLRRIGFRPETVLVTLPAPASLVVQMTRAIQMVRPVQVTATAADVNTVEAMVRARERTSGNGYFAYRADFMKQNPARFTDVLRRVPGVRVVRSFRGTTEVRLRSNSCPPLYWMDGQPLLGVPFDPDNVPPQTVEAIEVYSAASLVPVQFQGPPSAQGCGAIVIWTRRGERQAKRARIGADSLMRLLDAQRVFLSSEVDTPARVVSIHEPEYPDSLRAAGVSGSAVIEFIIEATGAINEESIGIVSATHLHFAEAVRIAVLEATFAAAVKAARPVAQVYQLPVTFTAPARSPP